VVRWPRDELSSAEDWRRTQLSAVTLSASLFAVVFPRGGITSILCDMVTATRDRMARGTVAALIVVGHLLLAYCLVQPLRLFTTRAASDGEAVLLLMPGDSREAKAQSEPSPIEPTLEPPPPPLASAPDFQIRPPTDSSSEQTAAQLGSGRSDAPTISDSDAGIAVLQRVMPQYPVESMRAGEEGGAVLQVLVDEKGQASDVRVARSSGYPRLDEAAVSAVSLWKFAPSTRGALAVSAWGELELRFNLNRYTISRIVDAPLDLVPPGQILNAANEAPAPGGEQALRTLLNEIRTADADSFDAPWLRDDLQRMKEALRGWGEEQTIQFLGPAAGNRWRPYEVRPEFRKSSGRETVELRWDVYRVSHDHGVSEWRIAIDRSGRIWCAHAGRGRGSSGPGMLQVAR
jgi:periplasmic protein TonB